MAITISGENNNDKILASDGVIDQISGFNLVGVVTATSFTGDLTGDVTGNLLGNVTGNINNSTLLLQTGGTERLRIDSSGRVLIGTATEGELNADDLTIATTGNTGLTIRSGTTSHGNIYFSDGTSGSAEYRGIINYAHNPDHMTFSTAGGERLRITSDGKVKICHVDGANPTEPLHVVATAVNQDIARFTGANKDRGLVISTAVSGSINDAVINYNADSQNSAGQHAFLTDGSEKLRIDSDGRLLIGVNASGQVDANLQVFRPTGTTSRLQVGNVATSASGVAGIDFCPSNKVMGSRIECQAQEDFSTSANRTAELVFFTRHNGTSSEKVRITSAGNVVIGHTSTGNKFQIGNTGHTGYAIAANSATYGTVLQVGDGATPTTAAALWVRNLNNGGTPTSLFRVNGNGNLGIGTDSPSKKVQISGTSGCQFQVHPHSVGFDIGVTSGDLAPHYQTKFVLYNGQFGSGTERLRITSDGKVGFNIPTTIRENIHTHQADSSQNYLRFTNTGTGTGASDGFNIGITAAEESLVWNFETTDMLFATANTLRLKIGSDGTPTFYSPAVAWHEGPAVLEASNGYAEIFFRSTGNTHGTSTTGTWALGKLAGTDGFGILKHGMSGGGAVRVDAALSISNDGHTTIGKYLKTPKRPAFIAGRTGGNETHTPQPFPLNATRLNVGNHYNTSTYKFVAPVAGLYYFFGQVYYNNGNGYYRVGIRKTPNGGSAIMLNTSALKVVGNDNAQQTSVIEELSVGDTVELWSDQNTAIQCYYNINNTSYGAHTYFMGYLIG